MHRRLKQALLLPGLESAVGLVQAGSGVCPNPRPSVRGHWLEPVVWHVRDTRCCKGGGGYRQCTFTQSISIDPLILTTSF